MKRRIFDNMSHAGVVVCVGICAEEGRGAPVVANAQRQVIVGLVRPQPSVCRNGGGHRAPLPPFVLQLLPCSADLLPTSAAHRAMPLSQHLESKCTLVAQWCMVQRPIPCFVLRHATGPREKRKVEAFPRQHAPEVLHFVKFLYLSGRHIFPTPFVAAETTCTTGKCLCRVCPAGKRQGY